MADPMRIRAQASGDKATVRVLMSHEMESGQRKDAAGKIVPAWFIQEITASHNGKVVMTAEWGPAVSKNPFFTVQRQGCQGRRKGVHQMGGQPRRHPHRRSHHQLIFQT